MVGGEYRFVAAFCAHCLVIHVFERSKLRAVKFAMAYLDELEQMMELGVAKDQSKSDIGLRYVMVAAPTALLGAAAVRLVW